MLKFADIGRAASKHSLKINNLSSKKSKSPGALGSHVDEKGPLKFVQRIFSKPKGSNPLALKVGEVRQSDVKSCASNRLLKLAICSGNIKKLWATVPGGAPG